MDETAADDEKFDAILKRMLEAKPLSKADISAKIKADREQRAAAKAAYLAHKAEKIKAAKKSGKRTKTAPPAND